MSARSDRQISSHRSSFWPIKILSTTIGETFADYLNTTFVDGLDLSDSTAFTAVLSITLVILIALLVAQFLSSGYRRWIYWPAIVLVSIVGTLVTDGLHDPLGVELWITTVIFAVTLALVLGLWFSSEQTLAMKSIASPRQETFYWITVLVTFALGISAGDQFAESMGFGYALSLGIFATAIGIIAVNWRFGVVGPVLAFWLAYILTRPLGAALGDLLSQAQDVGGLGLGTELTSSVFLIAIAIGITYFSISKKDLLVVPLSPSQKIK